MILHGWYMSYNGFSGNDADYIIDSRNNKDTGDEIYFISNTA